MTVRRAENKDIPFIEKALGEICLYHHNGRPDLFRDSGVKYTAAQLEEVIRDQIVLVALDGDEPCGYVIALPKRYDGESARCKYSSIYVDDLYVCADKRRKGAGRLLMQEVFSLAKAGGCYDVTLNVWEFPGSAMEFYKSLGMTPMAHTMEIIL